MAATGSPTLGGTIHPEEQKQTGEAHHNPDQSAPPGFLSTSWLLPPLLGMSHMTRASGCFSQLSFCIIDHWTFLLPEFIHPFSISCVLFLIEMNPEVPLIGGGVSCVWRSNTRGRWRACVCIKGSSDLFLLVIFVYVAAFWISGIYVMSVTLQPSHAYLCPVVHDVCSCSRSRSASSRLLVRY